jgi:hypothetical protein
MGDDWQSRHESLIDQQIRAAEARGEFDDLPGAGKPLTGLDKPYSEDWWLKQLAERENLGRHALPPSLALRKEAQDLRSGIVPGRSERAVRDAVADYNERVVAARRKPLSGPPVTLEELDVDEVVRAWRARREEATRRPDGPGDRKRRNS